MKNLQTDFVRFVQIKPSEGAWSFTGYQTENGEIRKAMQGAMNGINRPKAFIVTFSTKERIYRCGTKQKVWVYDGAESKQILLKDYLKDSPYCQGSKLAELDPSGVVFKIVDEVADASLVLDRKTQVIKAANAVLNMPDKEISTLAPILGITGTDPKMLRRFVLEFAENNPDEFFTLASDPTNEVRSLVRKAVQLNQIKKKASSLSWDGEVYADEDDMISVLLKDELKRKALESLVKKTK